MKYLISNQLSPNLGMADSLLGLKFFLNPFKKEISFTKFFGTDNYVMLNTARSGLSLIIEHLNLPKDKKIGIPAYTCAVTATPFLAASYQIEWIDTDSRGCLCPKSLADKANNLSCVLVIHAFGNQADLETIKTIKDQHNFIVIEDLAHYNPLPVEDNWPVVDYKLMSFGREKVYSCISGGAVLWNESPFALRQDLPNEFLFQVFREIMQPFWLTACFHCWYLGGKIIAAVLGKTGILPKAVHPAEKKGKKSNTIRSLSLSKKAILRKQFLNKNKNNDQKKEVLHKCAKLIKTRFPKAQIILDNQAFRIRIQFKTQAEKQNAEAWAKQKGWDLTDWNGTPISPNGCDLKAFGYQLGQCPNAEMVSQTTLHFPTNQKTYYYLPQVLKDLSVS